KARVECPVRQTSRQQEIGVVGLRVGISHRYDLSIRLNQNAVSDLEETAEIDEQPAIGVERRVQCSVRIVTREREIFGDSTIRYRRSCSDDLSIGLERACIRDIEIIVTEIGAYFPTGAERRVDTSVGQVSRHCEIVVI